MVTFYVNSVANGTIKEYTPGNFQPNTTSVIINCLFFASLSASLVAALASVIALQWVAYYDAAITRGGSSPEDRAKHRQFRYAGAVRWKMNTIIAALPLLLYGSVILFFAGLVSWMWLVNQTVGIVTAAGATVAVVFYGGSTLVAVFNVSAPYRTPLTRWIYSVHQFSSSVLYRLLHRDRHPSSAFLSWLERQHINYVTSSKREDRAVEEKKLLRRDGLIWLAGQLNISQGSYRRLLLLVGELVTLKKEERPSFETTEASWFSIFDLLGWTYLTTTQIAKLTTQDMHDMAILQKCYAMPQVKKIVDPTQSMGYIQDRKLREYWFQFSGTAEEDTWYPATGPNRLFLLLRDMPMASSTSPQEMGIAIRLALWHNLKSKPPQAWDEIFALAKSLPDNSELWSTCVKTFSEFTRLRHDRAWEDDRAKIYTSTMRKVIQMATTRSQLSRKVTVLMIQAYESLLLGSQEVSKNSAPTDDGPEKPVLANPFMYGNILEKYAATEGTAHDSIILLLARQLGSAPQDERVKRVQEIIMFLWLRPSTQRPRDWNDLIARFGQKMPPDPTFTKDWIIGADGIPHMLEILQYLATVQAKDPNIGSLWGETVPNQYNNPHFLEILQTFDSLMNNNCTQKNHSTMIDLLCQDLERIPRPDFTGYFTRERLDSFAKLRDPCLRTLAACARGPLFIRPPTPAEGYNQWRHSWERIVEFLLKVFPDSQACAVLQLQATLWPTYEFRSNLYLEALEKPAVLVRLGHGLLQIISNKLQYHLKRVFQYPVRCAGCIDGLGHLLFHLLHEADSRKLDLNLSLTSFMDPPIEKRMMRIALIIFCMIYEDLPIPFQYFFGGACQKELEDMLECIRYSEYHLLTLLWNVSTAFERNDSMKLEKVYTEDLAAILAGIHAALRLLPEPRSITILVPLSSCILRIRDSILVLEERDNTERQKVAEATINTYYLIREHVVNRPILGRRNNDILFCARGRDCLRPATTRLAPYEG